MFTGVTHGLSYSYDERSQLLTVYRRGVKLQEQGRLATLDQRERRAAELLRQLQVREDL